jgi:hypothetical protein
MLKTRLTTPATLQHQLLNEQMAKMRQKKNLKRHFPATLAIKSPKYAQKCSSKKILSSKKKKLRRNQVAIYY